MARFIAPEKLERIRTDHVAGRVMEVRKLADELGLHRGTVGNYRRLFRVMEEQGLDFNLRVARMKAGDYAPDRARVLEGLLPELVDAFTGNTGLRPKGLYKLYLARCKKPYSLKLFTAHFAEWRDRMGISRYHHLRIKVIPANDLAVLRRWRKRGHLAGHFKRAFALLSSFEGMALPDIARLMDKKIEVVMLWFDQYKAGGIAAMEPKKYALGPSHAENIKIKQDKLLKLLHEPPKNYGINRTSWRLQDLTEVYGRVYGEAIGKTTVKSYLHARNYGFKKSRESLTSTDPKFREKLDHIKNILANLAPDEAFFSIDEYGHFGVKLKGGRSFMPKNERKVVPQVQKNKGVLLVTAALELATNQVTHFYSRNKNTEEMIKLINILRIQYHDKKNLYLSWDGAIWHNSIQLKTHLAEVNAGAAPYVHLAPLPTSAQFLNVIESVFSGLARSVIHNSNYATTEDCMTAIDRHFAERNAHYLAHPQQAGKVIWGKELVKPQFDEFNHCDKRK
ncbi:MAG: IS630 family transposase [Mucilaginibacter sp.]